MSYSIADNYSVLNNYHYKNKSFGASALDWVSTPSRRVLGGRNVFIISQQYENEMTTARKIATVVFSILLCPIAFFSTVSLAVKLAVMPFTGEKNRIKQHSQKFWACFNQFNSAFQKNDYDLAIRIYRQNPHMGNRTEVSQNLFKIINRKINNGAYWQEIQTLLPLLKGPEAIELIHHAVKVRISHDHSQDNILLAGSDIQKLVENSLSGESWKTVKGCYQRLLSDCLSIKGSDDVMLSLFKMDLANETINHLIGLMYVHAKNEFERLAAKIEDQSQRCKIIETKSTNLFLTFNSPEEMEKVGKGVRLIRKANQQALSTLTTLEQLAPQQSQEKWGRLYSELKAVDTLGDIQSNKQKEFYRLMHEQNELMLHFCRAMSQNPSRDEIQILTKNLNDQFVVNCNRLVHLLSSSKPLFANHLDVLEMKHMSILSRLSIKVKGMITPAVA